MAAIREPFGRTQDGRAVEKITLRRGALEAEVLTYGGAVAALRAPDRAGKSVDVVLGYRTLSGYDGQRLLPGGPGGAVRQPHRRGEAHH